METPVIDFHCTSEVGAASGCTMMSSYAGFQITPRTAFATLEYLYKQRVQAEAGDELYL